VREAEEAPLLGAVTRKRLVTRENTRLCALVTVKCGNQQ
jgi:hypothetical protein